MADIGVLPEDVLLATHTSISFKALPFCFGKTTLCGGILVSLALPILELISCRKIQSCSIGIWSQCGSRDSDVAPLLPRCSATPPSSHPVSRRTTLGSFLVAGAIQPNTHNLTEERFNLAYGSGNSGHDLVTPKQKYPDEEPGRGKLLTSCQPGNRRRGQGTRTPLPRSHLQ